MGMAERRLGSRPRATFIHAQAVELGLSYALLEIVSGCSLT
jgi:hypothetical protein